MIMEIDNSVQVWGFGFLVSKQAPSIVHEEIIWMEHSS